MVRLTERFLNFADMSGSYFCYRIVMITITLRYKKVRRYSVTATTSLTLNPLSPYLGFFVYPSALVFVGMDTASSFLHDAFP